ncbi:RagB/SusD family nutrient uptake outer membrane protein [Confluentibacter sediminis]|uniref:RagB/SusD family nutrient uptake outer membrane protein n=1 Tax=Confluentibacter sediminis TaxID=2219045 RepID=UPI000DACAC54|nr:RagB/SusD family nutrient uptake outer membrane protein [Confluentibacter sediminis]
MKQYILKKSISGILAVVLCVIVSCDDYLGIEPKGQRLLESTEDYNLWLDSERLHESAIYELNYFSDVTDLPTIDDLWENVSERAYTWQPQLTNEPLDSSPIWAYSYGNMYYYNAVINEVLESIGGTENERLSLRAEALLGRSLIYLNLVNLYGKVYNETTASQDLSVPFVTSIDVTDETPQRSTVQQIYNHIISDLEEAIPNLPLDNSGNRFRGSVAAAYGVLARAYLYMGKYDLASQNAQLALDNGPNEILMKLPGQVIDYKTRPDIILARKGGGFYFSTIIPTLDLLQSFDVDDQRLKLNYKGLSSLPYPYTFTTRGQITYEPHGLLSGAKDYPNWGIDVAEMNLIIAEAAARSGDTSTACDQLDLLRSKRFLAADYVRFDSTDPEEVLEKVLQERIFEFPFVGLRWYDMRRLAAEGRMSTVYRYDGLGNIIATLEPDNDRYTLQIPMQIMSYNDDWEQNP